MANPSKRKGDVFELAAVRFFVETCPDLCVPRAKRMLGAGRKEDVGDLHVFPDTAVQVRALKIASLGQAVRSSALDSVVQAANGEMPYALGMVPVPRARAGTVRWLACTTPDAWPTGEPDRACLIDFALISHALTWLRDDVGPHGFMAYPRERRIAWLASGSATPVLVAPIEAWLDAYRVATSRTTAPLLELAPSSEPDLEQAPGPASWSRSFADMADPA